MAEASHIPSDSTVYVPVARADEFRPGERMVFDIGERVVAVFQVGERFFAIADVCSHDNGPVAEGEVVGQEIVCPRHGARFSLETGKALSLPAVVGIPAYPVRVVGGEVQVGLPAGPGEEPAGS
jgi:3-phenylpropionate/trans-cinnamate dioxygenase ferredoxin subunit